MPKVILTVSGKFSAAHFLTVFPESHPCRRVHGHTWEYEVSVVWDNIPARGYCIDFSTFKQECRSIIDQKFDHMFLNDILPIPTAENIAEYVHTQLSKKVSTPIFVKIKESDSAWVTYTNTPSGEHELPCN